jgi:RNA polymerase sigma-70 factor (ECF subfamily)
MRTSLHEFFADDDQHAFGELVRRHQSSVRGLLRQLTRTDIALADDLAQEAFLRAYKNIRSFRGEARFSTWLIESPTIAFAKMRAVAKELVGVDEEQWQAEQDPQTVDPGLRHDLMHALNLLPLHERTALCFAAKTVCRTMKLARVLEIPLGTVKTNVLRGREKLKRHWSAWGPN